MLKETRLLTNAEKQARWRNKEGARCINFRCDIQSAGALLYVKKQWGLKTDAEAVQVALRFLAVQTRKNPDMTVLDLEV